ncbi:component of SufBCD complex [Aestuariivita boseongensis]|uniref:component of SufBCD complex n=1 Tax=Aestuariivita boseongensis TaxID=1470562 RepID=UPI000B1C8494|nr:component of SufBCD complex [Aestuariivita boseongensis]
MNWYQELFELIDMRSFSNLWFWIALAVMWSSASHWVLGVPFDMVARARRDKSGRAAADLVAIAQVNVNRILMIARVSGLWIFGFTCFMMTGLVMLGWVYWVEFAQALFLLTFPICLVALQSLRTAQRLEHETPSADDLCKILARQRLGTQILGTVSIFITSVWGMYQNLSIGPLGG